MSPPSNVCRPGETEGRQCVCNRLTGTIGLAQSRAGGEVELPLISAGKEAANSASFLRPGGDSYSAAEVIHRLPGKWSEGFISVPGANVC